MRRAGHNAERRSERVRVIIVAEGRRTPAQSAATAAATPCGRRKGRGGDGGPPARRPRGQHAELRQHPLRHLAQRRNRLPCNSHRLTRTTLAHEPTAGGRESGHSHPRDLTTRTAVVEHGEVACLTEQLKEDTEDERRAHGRAGEAPPELPERGGEQREDPPVGLVERR